LVDIKGRLIGMNVAIATGRETQGTTEGQSAGISFAIPLGTIESVASQLITNGRVARGYLGISWPPGREPVIYEPSIHQMGVRIARTAEKGPAEKAGLQAGDIITSIEGQSVSAIETLRSLVTSLSPGQAITVDAYRGGEKRTFRVTLGEFPSENLALGAVSTELLRYGMRLRNTEKGAAVRAVATGSAAAEAGVKEGQLILKVDDKPVGIDAQAMTAAAEAGILIGNAVTFTVVEDSKDVSTPQEIRVRIMR